MTIALVALNIAALFLEQAGMPLMTALTFRASSCEFAATPVSLTTLGELLWAADGVNRPITGGRTAPSPHEFNEIDIYVALPNGAPAVLSKPCRRRAHWGIHRLICVNGTRVHARTLVSNANPECGS